MHVRVRCVRARDQAERERERGVGFSSCNVREQKQPAFGKLDIGVGLLSLSLSLVLFFSYPSIRLSVGLWGCGGVGLRLLNDVLSTSRANRARARVSLRRVRYLPLLSREIRGREASCTAIDTPPRRPPDTAKPFLTRADNPTGNSIREAWRCCLVHLSVHARHTRARRVALARF